jgi:transposase InsO family protein
MIYLLTKVEQHDSLCTRRVRCTHRPPLYDHSCHAAKDIFKYIEVFYNRKRRHASLGYVSPSVYEQMHEMKQGRAA